MEACGCLGVLIVGAGAVTTLGAIIYWVLNPVDRAAKDCRLPTQFTIADFLCLFGLFHLPPMLFHCLPADPETTTRRGLIPVYVVCWLVVTVVWWFGVGTLSRAGITRPWHRVVFLLVIFPLLLIGIFAQFVVPFWLLATFRPVAMASQVGLIALFLGLGHSVRFLLKSAKRPADAPPPASDEP